MSIARAQIVTRATSLHDRPERFSPLASELLFGEIVDILEEGKDWVKIRNHTDGYEGFIRSASLSFDLQKPTHKIIKRHTLLYTAPEFKTQPLTHLPLMAQITVMDQKQNGFIALQGGGWVWAGDIAPLTDKEPDFVTTAERFIGTPYLWGGRTDRGLDCSALVQLALMHAGIDCPRDTGDQINHFQPNLDLGGLLGPSSLQRGDLVFLERHVGIMVNAERILNATSRTMDTRIEALEHILPHYEGGILAVKRIL